MKNQASEVINNVAVFVMGLGFVGDATFKAPAIKFKKITDNTAAGEVDRTYGAVEKLEASCKLRVTNRVIFTAMIAQNNAGFIFTSSLTGDKIKGRRDVIKGSFDYEENEMKNGEVIEVDLTISPNYWIKEIDGLPMVEIDMNKNVVRLSGRDLLAESRKAAGV